MTRSAGGKPREWLSIYLCKLCCKRHDAAYDCMRNVKASDPVRVVSAEAIRRAPR